MQAMQAMQALQTLTFLGVGNLGQLGASPSNTPIGWTFMVEATIPTNNVQANKEPMHIFDDVEGVEDVLIVGLNKREITTIQHKTHRAIVNKARKMALDRKAKGLKPLFVTCDLVWNPTPPPTPTPHKYLDKHVAWVLWCFGS